MAIGWLADLTEANTYFLTSIEMINYWPTLSDAEKTAALTTAYNRLTNSDLLSLPASPTPEQLENLKYAQLEYAGDLSFSMDGGARRRILINDGVSSAGVVKESYFEDAQKMAGQIPDRILDILDDYKSKKKQGLYLYQRFRKETVSEDYS